MARRLLLPRLSAESREESFVAGLALLGMDADWSASILDVLLEGEPAQREGLRDALRFSGRPGLEPRLLAAFERASAFARAALLDVLVARGHPPPVNLGMLVSEGTPELACAALRAARHFPAHVDQALVRQALRSELPSVRDVAQEVGLVLGLPEAWSAYEQAIARPTESWRLAAVVWALGTSGEELAPLLKGLDDPGRRRDALWALGFSGRREGAEALLPWLRDNALGPLAGEAFAAITGLPVAQGYSVPSDEDTEGDLPVPDAVRIEAWWKTARGRFNPAERYLSGVPWSPERLVELLDHGSMRRRPVLALELAIRTGGRCQLDTGLLVAQQLREVANLRGDLGRVPAGPFRELMRGGTSSSAAPRAERMIRRESRAPASSGLVVTGTGMVSAIGHGAVESCAALRARIVRPRPLPFSILRRDAPGEVVPTGHPLRGLLDGFTGMARLLKLGAFALEDLLQSTGLSASDAAFFRQTALLLCLSPTRRDDFDFQDELIVEKLPSRLLAHCGLSLPMQNVSVLHAGHAAGLLALHQVSQHLQERRFQRAVVLGVDSLVDADSLQWLADRRRLKTPESPMGLMPGEAAVAVLVESHAEAARRGATLLGSLAAVGVARMEGDVRRGVESGRALARVIRQVWPEGSSLVGDIYCDVNGEHARALEWGSAQALLQETHPVAGAHIHAPAECLGDTGAAGGLISMCASLQGFARGYAHGEQALVWSSSDSGEFAAARLSRA
ncbi:hypothetical protein [Myxococcus hansupus]|uniref:hypothetical protein n=1 Tax=Pseudomyxococcus hansupus TaxID=1297742 RepID=UPI000676533C|nr:hypothetical protein [Myxococcus hansupus]